MNRRTAIGTVLCAFVIVVSGKSEAADDYIRVSLDQGRFSALMPATSVSGYTVNTASKVYFDHVSDRVITGQP